LHLLCSRLIETRLYQDDECVIVKPKYTQGELRKSNQILQGLVELVYTYRMDWNILVLIYLHYERVYFKNLGLE